MRQYLCGSWAQASLLADGEVLEEGLKAFYVIHKAADALLQQRHACQAQALLKDLLGHRLQLKLLKLRRLGRLGRQPGATDTLPQGRDSRSLLLSGSQLLCSSTQPPQVVLLVAGCWLFCFAPTSQHILS